MIWTITQDTPLRPSSTTFDHNSLPDIITKGDVAIAGSKRYGKLENFFIVPRQWDTIRATFFQKNKLPQNPNDVPAYLATRLDTAFAYFLEREKGNPFAKVGKEGWELSKDPAEELTPTKKLTLEKLKTWLSDKMRVMGYWFGVQFDWTPNWV